MPKTKKPAKLRKDGQPSRRGTNPASLGNLNKPIEIDDATRERVEMLSAYGVPQEIIAKIVGLSVDTLGRHCRAEIEIGAHKANERVAHTAYKMAISGDSPAATFFWLKTRARWRETDARDLEDLRKQLEQARSITQGLDLSTLSDAELATLEQLLDKAKPGPGPISDRPGAVPAEPKPVH